MKKVTIGILIVVMIIVLMIGIGEKEKINQKQNDSYVKITINGQEVFISEKMEDEYIDLNTLNTEFDTRVKVEAKNYQVKINKRKVKNKEEISLGHMKINKNDKIEIEIKLWGEFTWKKYVINTLPSQFPEYEFEGISQQKGEYYVTTYQLEAKKYQHYIYKLNHIGEVTFYQATPKVCYQFRKNQIEGKVRYTYLESYGELREGFSLSLPTTLVVLDEKYNKIKEIHYYTKEKDERSGEVDRKLDNHDYLYLADNHYILSGFEIKTVYDFPGYEGKAFEVWNSKIQEVKDGKVLWEFQSIEHKQLYQYCDEQNKDMMTYEPYLDYMHFNAIKVDPTDGNLVCSFRNIDAIIKLDRQTGNIIWVLGGIGDEFGLTEQQKFSKQHSISFLSDHSLLIYDNGCKDKKTRILIIKIDEQKKAIEKFTHYNLGIYAVRMGAVQAIQEEDHTYLVTYGVGDNPYGFQELNLETLEPITSFKLKENNALYCVNKSD